MFPCVLLFQTSVLTGLRILTHPKDVVCKPGDRLGFSIETSKTAQSYKWYLNGNEISSEDEDYEGSTTEVLSINKCLPKHKGSYKCVLVTELDTSLTTESAVLKIGMYTELCQTSCLLCCPQLDTDSDSNQMANAFIRVSATY